MTPTPTKYGTGATTFEEHCRILADATKQNLIEVYRYLKAQEAAERKVSR